MASKVELCNLALSHLGDSATVSSIDPPEGSAQAEKCAIYFPLARDSLLELHDWKFAQRRILLQEVDLETWDWEHAYVLPNEMIRVLKILPADSSTSAKTSPYERLEDPTGESLILTNEADASCLYTVRVEDTSKWSPLFELSFAWMLASMLAGPLLKGDVGAAESKRCTQVAFSLLGMGKVADAKQTSNNPEHVPSWIAGR